MSLYTGFVSGTSFCTAVQRQAAKAIITKGKRYLIMIILKNSCARPLAYPLRAGQLEYTLVPLTFTKQNKTKDEFG